MEMVVCFGSENGSGRRLRAAARFRRGEHAMISTYRKWIMILGCLAMVVGPAIAAAPSSAGAQTIIEEWSTVKVPPAPELKPVTVDPWRRS
jgi:hypothetical protein